MLETSSDGSQCRVQLLLHETTTIHSDTKNLWIPAHCITFSPPPPKVSQPTPTVRSKGQGGSRNGSDSQAPPAVQLPMTAWSAGAGAAKTNHPVIHPDRNNHSSSSSTSLLPSSWQVPTSLAHPTSSNNNNHNHNHHNVSSPPWSVTRWQASSSSSACSPTVRLRCKRTARKSMPFYSTTKSYQTSRRQQTVVNVDTNDEEEEDSASCPPPRPVKKKRRDEQFANAKPRDHDHPDDDDDDDSFIEFVGIRSPSQGNVKPADQEQPEKGWRAKVFYPTTTTTTQENHRLNVEDENQSATSTSSTRSASARSPVPYYSYVSSAYVQNLAEICYTMLHDRRWTVLASANSQSQPQPIAALQPLFRWEDGEDVSAMTALSRRYLPPSNKEEPAVVPAQPCSCLVCQDPQTAVAAASAGETTPAAGEDRNWEETEQIIDQASMAVDEDDDRSLYLYCRLFYRKGPWFRLDDVYTRYYAPPDVKDPKQGPIHVNPLNRAAETTAEVIPNRVLRSMDSHRDANIDDANIDKHMEAVSQLLSDLHRLHEKGLIRTFESEEECGKTVGVSLLLTEEQKKVLTKLGGGGKKPQAPNKAAPPKSGAGAENEILKQMATQRALHFWPQIDNGNRARRLLPVQKHVDTVLLEKLACVIVQRCSRTEYVPAAVMRQYSSQIYANLRTMLRDICPIQTKLISCFRLRESPTRTLQRCVRLYLCATSGPGQMRGDDGTSAWRSLADWPSDIRPPLANLIPPPGAHTFHHVAYPGLMHRFGLVSMCFKEAYQPCPIIETPEHPEDIVREQIFKSRESFRTWETCVELRANVDYLLLLHEEIRRQSQSQKSQLHDGANEHQPKETRVDFLGLLSTDGQRSLLRDLLRSMSVVDEAWIEATLNDLGAATACVKQDHEKILIIIGKMATHILLLRNKQVDEIETKLMSERPWLRHLWWEGCLAYVLWDIIHVFEKNQLYQFAITALETLLFGRNDEPTGDSCVTSFINDPSRAHSTILAPLLISRRARGKAFDRLIIDYKHGNRLRSNQDLDPTLRKRSVKLQNTKLDQFCRFVIEKAARTGFISFSATRCLARRLQKPLAESLESVRSIEATMLGIRLENTSNDCLQDDAEGKMTRKKYTDWQPVTDFAVANSLANNQKGVGSRCSYVGFEDEQAGASSLNVEQLAMEFYATGRLPESEAEIVQGGWKGWHDEGSRIRSLFRILTPASVLGMDWGSSCRKFVNNKVETTSIHLSPYQGAPFDLHVGFELHSYASNLLSPRLSFNFRRRCRIEVFLLRLSQMNGQDLSDLVYNSIYKRFMHMKARRQKDPVLERDLQQLRTLSLLAVGLGGKQLSSIFRCLFFDYRHYSGGLADLTLVRSLFDGSIEHVDLGEWIGEGFSSDNKATSSILYDDEFLGCSKVGDSRSRNYSHQQPKSTLLTASQALASQRKLDTIMPQKLLLSHNGRKVNVECMLVEVKSSNDRLDPRQEDWLNILDQNGNARVCKFTARKARHDKKPGDTCTE